MVKYENISFLSKCFEEERITQSQIFFSFMFNAFMFLFFMSFQNWSSLLIHLSLLNKSFSIEREILLFHRTTYRPLKISIVFRLLKHLNSIDKFLFFNHYSTVALGSETFLEFQIQYSKCKPGMKRVTTNLKNTKTVVTDEYIRMLIRWEADNTNMENYEIG